jgi:prepilin-type N-terminal cleavage/methylation domain-containing protein
VRVRSFSRRSAGFSMIELLIAMTITVIISGAVYALIASGQSSFRREPALSDRQQNARVALSMIERDAHMAGMKMGNWVQAFRVRHGASDAAGVLLDGRGWNGSDELVINGVDENCPELAACGGGVKGANIFTYEPIPDCFVPGGFGTVGLVWIAPGPAWVTPGRQTSSGTAFGESKGAGPNCGAGGHLNFPMGRDENENAADFCTLGNAVCNSIFKMQIIRYEIELDPVDGVPALYRSAQGGLDAAGNYVAPPDAAGGWQMIATGIDDLQLQYIYDGPPPADCPGGGGLGNPANCAALVVPNTWGSITRGVLVNLSATTIGGVKLGNQTEVRASLVGSVTPRAAMIALRQGGGWL